MINWIKWAQVLLLGAVVLYGKDVCAYFDNIKEFKLDNGLQVVLWENHRAPIIKQMVFYKTGAVDEITGKGGLAHLLEHLMFRGTKKLPGQSFNDLMEKNGAISNAYTTQDVTAYHQFLDISRLETAMFAEADRMENLDFSDEDFVAEQQIVLEERRQRIDNNPSAKFYERLRKTLWQEHPYSKQVAGEVEEINRLTLNDAKEFYRRYYSPNNAVLVLAGDIDETKAKELTQKHYGKLQPYTEAHRLIPEIVGGYKGVLEMQLSGVKMPRLLTVYITPSFNYQPEKVYAFEVLGEYLGGDKNSYFYQRMVMQNKKALSVDVSYNPFSRSAGVMEITAVPREKADDDFANAVLRGMDYAMAKLNDEQLEMVKNKIIADLIYSEDNLSQVAELIGAFAARGINLKKLQEYEDNIRKVSLDDVKEAFTYLQTTAPRITGLLNPKEN